jgi:hypothetical protein
LPDVGEFISPPLAELLLMEPPLPVEVVLIDPIEPDVFDVLFSPSSFSSLPRE